MSGVSELRDTLAQLVAEVPDVERRIQIAGSQPEAQTIDQLLTPLLDALGFDRHHRTPQHAIRQSLNNRLGWVDFRLNRSPDDHKGLALLEAKAVTETGDLWASHGKQTRRYLRDYQLALGEDDPVRWIILTNFRELHVLNIADREPFLKLTCDQYAEQAELIYRLLNREQLINDQITEIYYEKRKVPLGKSFLTDLKLWRLILANGLKQSQPNLTLDQAKALSQQILDRIILIRVLETHGLQPYYSLVRQYVNWETQTRNHHTFPFFDYELLRTFDDIEMDLNTDLFKRTLMEKVADSLKEAPAETGSDVLPRITMANKYVRAVIDPDIYWTDEDQDIRFLIGNQTGQQRYAYSTPYNYDFHTLTQDIIGQVYEQFLAHKLTMLNETIVIRSDQSLRQQEGAYYTPMPVVTFLVDGIVGNLLRSIRADADRCLNERRYVDAQTCIHRLRTIKVLDLACGSGTFLISAYSMLVDTYRWWNDKLPHIRTDHFSNDWIEFAYSGLRPEPNPGDAVLRNSIFGIDKDSQAVEMAKLNLWLLLLRTQPEDYARQGERAPKTKLPDLSQNVVCADSLYPAIDVAALLGNDEQIRVVIGNPPWGADLKGYGASLGDFELAKGQYDSYELFLERATRILRPGDKIGYVVPDSILQPPEHARLREFILQNYDMDSLVKLGEGVFEDVFRGAVALQFTRSQAPSNTHTVRSRIVVKSERNQVLKAARENTLQELLDSDGHYIPQSHFGQNKDKVFDLFTDEADLAVTDMIDRNTLDWKEVTTSSRGVELSKTGAVMACPVCGIWQNIPRKQKNGTFPKVICANAKCSHEINYETSVQATIISESPTVQCIQPIVVGEGINRYQTLALRYIDTTKVKLVPRCPNPDPNYPKRACNDYDPFAAALAPNETRICQRCQRSYTLSTVRDYVRLGINYKAPEMYAGEKLLVRKTGRGIYATIDRTGAYTNQVVFIFKLKSVMMMPEQYRDLRLGYLLGVLNSRMMLYRYYKALGDIEWKSFPYMTQDTIMGLPVRRIDFSNAQQVHLHNRIADLVDAVIVSGRAPDAETDNQIERLVRQLYEVDTPAMNQRIDLELERISKLGTLLGSSSGNGEVVADDTDDAEE